MAHPSLYCAQVFALLKGKRMRIWAMVGAALAAAIMTLAPARALEPLSPQPAGLAWPTAAWETGPLPPGTNAAALTAAVDAVMAKPHPLLGETRAVLVVAGGKLVFERYLPGYDRESRHVSWSAAKSITQALVGAAVLQGRVNIDRPMPTAPSYATVTWRQWLQMVDGQSWLEVGAPSIIANQSAQALFGEGRRDVAAFCAARPVKAPPGTRWTYNTCGLTLVAAALGRVIAPQGAPAARRAAMAAWMRDSLFAPIGMTSAVPEFDAQGTFLGGSLLYANARDYARFGYLYLRDGVWEGRRVFPEGWVDFARSPQPGAGTNTYGAGFWITPPTGDGVGPRSTIIGEGMRDAFSVQGRSGQVVMIVPSKDLVIVRLGLFAQDSAASWNTLGDWLGVVGRAFPDRPGRPAT